MRGILLEINKYINVLNELEKFDITDIKQCLESYLITFKDKKQKEISLLMQANDKSFRQIDEQVDSFNAIYNEISDYKNIVIEKKDSLQNLIKKTKGKSKSMQTHAQDLLDSFDLLHEKIDPLKQCYKKLTELKENHEK